MSNSEVTYLPVPNFIGYRVGSDGTVWTRFTRFGAAVKLGCPLKLGEVWNKLKPSTQRRGYLMVCLTKNRLKYYRQVHRLVLEVFTGPCPNGYQCRHLNGIPNDNRLENLTWGTVQENHDDKRRHGTTLTGEKHRDAKLVSAEVLEIRKSYKAGGISQQKLADKYGVHQATISSIIRRDTWSHI